MHKLQLDQLWDYCPPAWKNFVDIVRSAENIENGCEMPVNMLDDYLTRYSGHYVEYNRQGSPYVEFASEEDATAFVLRYA